MNKKIVGIMGPGSEATDRDIDHAHQIGRMLALAGYAVLTGGRKAGVMDAALRGAKEGGGETIAILPARSKSDASAYADTIIVTGMGNARNCINVLTSDVIVACGIGPGTLSEIALALKEGRHVVLLIENASAQAFLTEMSPRQVHIVGNAEEATATVDTILGG